ncbi:MAG: RluA family pseudouridine synthase [Verrucomicrobia bacterium]|nr:RluA family pseudouridine synthase [Verrucomicrobiota bacterium]
MAKPTHIELGFGKYGTTIPILYEDRSILAIDKPAGWLLVPFNWQQTKRNLQAAISSSIAAGDYWAKSRNIKFLRNIHRLDGDTSGILLMGKSMGALETYGDLFESRKMEKRYLAIVRGIPKDPEWTCELMLGQDPAEIGRMVVDERNGKESETHFKVLASSKGDSLIEARPVTGRTHQIRVHLKESGYPILGDELYGPPDKRGLGLRAFYLSYTDPFTKRRIHINAPIRDFLKPYGFGNVTVETRSPVPGGGERKPPEKRVGG